MTSLSTLNESIWNNIVSHLNQSDLQNLLLVNHSIKEKVKPYLYHELTLTEWASTGAQLALAIHQGIVSNETCECVKGLRFQFTTIEEISEALRLSLEIQHRMPNINEINVEAHRTEDALMVVGILTKKYKKCSTIGVVSRAPCESSLAINKTTLPLLTSLHTPRIFKKDILLLCSICDLEVDEIVDDGSSVQFIGGPGRVFDRLSIPYSSYSDLGSPPSYQLELHMDVKDEHVVINDSACEVLKLSAARDLPEILPKLHTPSLRVLILCNIAPLPTIRLLKLNNFESVEFISIAPVTLPALQALTNIQFLPSLQLLLVIVSRASFLSDNQILRKKESHKLVQWLQMLAAQYPVDVRDFSWLLRQDIYFSDGLWCLASQTNYRKYLPLVVPQPLGST